MAKYKSYNYSQTVMLPVSLEDQLTPGTLAFAINTLVEEEERNYSQEMIAKIDTKRGRELYPHRIAIVEPVFANIRTNKRLDRFSLWGKIKVNIQWLLYCMVHNIEKIVNFGYATV